MFDNRPPQKLSTPTIINHVDAYISLNLYLNLISEEAYYIPLSIGQICFIAHELTCFDRSYCCYGLMNTGSELDFCHSWRCSVTKIKSLLVGFL